jgi:hypothetical protein
MHGPFSLESLREALASGDVTAEDLVQVGGLPIWRPLRQVLGLPEPRPAIPSSTETTPAEAPTPEPSARVSETLVHVSPDDGPPDWIVIREWAWSRLREDFTKRSVGIGLVFLGVGVIAGLFALWPFLFWLPWFGLAFIAGISALMRGKTLPGVGILIGAGVLPIALSLILQPRPASSSAPEPGESRSAQASTLAPRTAATPVAKPPASPSSQPAVPVRFESVRPTPAPVPSATPHGKAPAPSGPQSKATLSEAPLSADAIPAIANSAIVEIPTASTPDPTAPPSGQPDPAAPRPIIGGDLVQKHPDCFVVVKDGSASGSGFICRDAQKTWLFTNVHVAAGMKNPQFSRLDGSLLRVTTAEAGGGRDVMRFGVADSAQPLSAQPLEILQNVDASARIGDDVVVLGNSGGGGVVTALAGKLIGIGPDRVEVNAEFIPGNSGSPILHVPSGKVIGIATYLTKRYEEFSGDNARTDKAAVATVRRFGYRIDGIQKWEPVNWTAFHAEAEQIRQISALTSDVFDFLEAVRRRAEPQFATDTLRRPATEWLSGIRRSRVSVADRTRATQNFLSSLRLMVRSDVTAADSRIRYSFFREQLRKEQEVRDRLYKAFDDDVKTLTFPSMR